MKKIFQKIKKWAENKALPWIKVGWLNAINVLIVFYAYSQLDNATLWGFSDGPAALVGLWVFILIVYWVFWKLLGLEKLFKKD